MNDGAAAGIAERLAAIADELDELAFDRLREAAGEGATRRPASDRQLVQARRAVEKAIHALRAIEADPT